MEKYLGCKIVMAEPMNKYDFYMNIKGIDCKEDNQEGYKVVYKDGYVSWSPKRTFEEAYRKTNGLTLGLAIEALKKGFKAKRKGWNGKNQYIELANSISYLNAEGNVVNCNHDAIGNKAIAFVGTSGIQMGWLASQADMLAEDWEMFK